MLEAEKEDRTAIWNQMIAAVEDYIGEVEDLPIDSGASAAEVQSFLSALNFDRPMEPREAINFVAEGARRFHVHNWNPRYFGLFVPAPTTMGIAGDMLASAFNLVLGGWPLSPFGVELERMLLGKIALKFGFDSQAVDGVFTSGGTEANHTAVLIALTRLSPIIRTRGLAAFGEQPLVYTSQEAHRSVHKVAMLCGLGCESVREIPVDHSFRMDPALLRTAIENDRAAGKCPCMVIATAGTTNTGAIDPLAQIAEVAREHSLWFHVDAAWGGAAALVPELRPLLDGIERADSITFDAHKWLSVPMTAGIFLTRHRDALEQTFNVSGPYMPRGSNDAAIDPFRHSMQWSRPCRGLKVLLSLAVAGWEGYAQMIRSQVHLGNLLRAALRQNGWVIINDTPLPLVCFQDLMATAGHSRSHLEKVAQHALRSGRVWISITDLARNGSALRACVTNFLTQEKDVEELVSVLGDARTAARR